MAEKGILLPIFGNPKKLRYPEATAFINALSAA